MTVDTQAVQQNEVKAYRVDYAGGEIEYWAGRNAQEVEKAHNALDDQGDYDAEKVEEIDPNSVTFVLEDGKTCTLAQMIEQCAVPFPCMLGWAE